MEASQELLYKVLQKGKVSETEIEKISRKIRDGRDVESSDYVLLKLIEDLDRVEKEKIDLEFVDICVEEEIFAYVVEIAACDSPLEKEFNISLTQDMDGFFAECIDLPGCFSEGSTEKEALENIKEAIQAHLECMAKYNVRPERKKRVFQVYL